MKKSLRVLSVTLAGAMLLSTSALACTGVYVGKDVSDQGTYLIARSEDQGQGDYNKMFQVQPRVENVPGRFITDTATGFQIPLPATTYKYTYVPDYTRGDDGMYPGSCTNEYGVSITATVSTSTCEAWEAEDPFVEPGLREAILAASVAAVSTTAREAVDVLLGYVDEYGSEEGNTVMITDQDEAWIVEIYGGHRYCAMKMPDDKVAVFGNHNMIGLVDPKATPEDGYIYSDGLFDTIDKLGLAVKEGELYHLAKSVTNNTREDYNNMRNWAGMTILAPSLAGEYDSDEFYPLFYSPDEKVSVLTVMDIYRNRYEGTPLDVTLPGNEENRVIGTERSSQIHILQTFPDWPAECSSIDWLALGNTEHSVFIPFFSGITDTAPAYHLDGDTYNPDGAFWKFKSICTIAEQNRSLYSQGVKDFWKLQEELMYQEMLDAAPAMLAKYSESRAAGDAYVTQLGIDMAEREMLLADNLYAKLLTTMMHNTGLSSSKTPTTFLSDVPLRQVAESRGYTVTWNKADGSTTIAKGDVTYTFTPESYECVTGTGETIELTHYCYVRDGFTQAEMEALWGDNPAQTAAPPWREGLYTELQDGAALHYGGRMLRCVLTPGHTPGHLCLYDPARRRLFCGDHVLFHITPNICRWQGVEDSLGDYLSSLDRTAALDTAELYPAHRAETGDLRQRTAELKAHHARRLEDTLRTVEKAPGLTAYQIAGRMRWSIRCRNWADFPLAQKFFAVGEALAHLDHLEAQGRVFRQEIHGKRVYFAGVGDKI